MILFAEHMLSEEIILNEVSLGGSTTIIFALNKVKGFFSAIYGSTAMVLQKI